MTAEIDLVDIAEEDVEIVAEHEDGSVTIAITPDQQLKLQYEMKEELESGIEELLEEEALDSVTDVTYNYELTTFHMQVDPSLYTGLEVFYGAAFYIYGNMYQAISGIPQEEISTEVHIVDQETGEVLETADSTMMENMQLRQYIQELEAEIAALRSGSDQSEKTVYRAGEEWIVDGQWSFTINSVTAVQERSEYTNKTPAQVVIIDYTYENLGYTDEIMDLYFTMSSVVDEAGEVAVEE